MRKIEGSPLLSSIERQPQPSPSLEELKNSAEGDELLEELFEEVENGAHRYFRCVLNHEQISQVQQHRVSAQEYRDLHERFDHDRRIAHNALCDKLKILARTQKKAGRDTKWLHDIAGPNHDRNAIKRWALKTVFNELREREHEGDSA